MADDPNKRGKPDRTRIDVSEDYECRYWSEKFAVSPSELKQAVIVAGPMVDDLARYFGRSPEPVTLVDVEGAGTAASSQTTVLEKAQRAGSDAVEFAKKQAQEARLAAERTTDEVMKFIGARPVASVAIGVAIGCLLGWMASGAARQRLRDRRTTKALRSVPLEHERLVRLREWPRTRRGTAPL